MVLVNDEVTREQFLELRDQVARNRRDLDALQGESRESRTRADAGDDRADKADLRVDDLQTRSDLHSGRMDGFENRLEVDEAMIAELHSNGLLSQEQARHLEEALRSSRVIGAAIGIIMANRQVDETGAFQVLSKSSQNTNRKLRDLAEEIVRTGDVSDLPHS